jgi:hypothetical protein
MQSTRLELAIFSALMCTSTLLHAAAFQNLDFEQATVAAAPSNYTPFDAYDPIASGSALPFWTVTEDSTVVNAVWGVPVSLDETSVALISSSNKLSSSPIQGNYSVQLTAFADAPSTYFKTASISQTGDVPAGTKSIQFLVRMSAQGGPTNPIITMNGVSIPIVTLSISGSTAQMAADVSAFAGTTATLQFEAAGAPGQPFPNEDLFDLDSVNFSTEPAPEPSMVMLVTVGVLLMTTRGAVVNFHKTLRPF